MLPVRRNDIRTNRAIGATLNCSVLASAVGFLVIASALVVGCTNRSTKPELDPVPANKGVVVGQLVLPGRYEWFYRNAEYTIRALPPDGKAVPEDDEEEKYFGSLVDSYLVRPLPPGRYELRDLYFHIGKVNYWYPVKVDFSIEQGQISSIGLVVSISDRTKKTDTGKFVLLQIDNTASLNEYLRANFSTQLQGQNGAAISKAYGKFISNDMLPKVREEIARHVFNLRNHTILANRMKYVYGPAGTIVSMDLDAEKNKNGCACELNVYDPGTTDAIVDVAIRKGTDAYFLSESGTVHKITEGKVQTLKVPDSGTLEKLAVLADSTIVVVDSKLAFYFTLDEGMHWTRNNSIGVADHEAKPRLTAYNDDVFVYAGWPAHLKNIAVFSGTTGSISLIPAPDVSLWKSEFIFVAGANSGVLEPKGVNGFLYALDRQTNSWKYSKKPSESCDNVFLTNKSGDEYEVSCDNGKYMSKDGGKTWAEMREPRKIN